jgi:hypothetical protein
LGNGPEFFQKNALTGLLAGSSYSQNVGVRQYSTNSLNTFAVFKPLNISQSVSGASYTLDFNESLGFRPLTCFFNFLYFNKLQLSTSVDQTSSYDAFRVFSLFNNFSSGLLSGLNLESESGFDLIWPLL